MKSWQGEAWELKYYPAWEPACCFDIHFSVCFQCHQHCFLMIPLLFSGLRGELAISNCLSRPFKMIFYAMEWERFLASTTAPEVSLHESELCPMLYKESIHNLFLMSNFVPNEHSMTQITAQWPQPLNLKQDRPNRCIEIEQCIRYARPRWDNISWKSHVLLNRSQKKPQRGSRVHSSFKWKNMGIRPSRCISDPKLTPQWENKLKYLARSNLASSTQSLHVITALLKCKQM